MNLEAIDLTRLLEDGIQTVLSFLWILVLFYLIKNAPIFLTKYFELLEKLNSTIYDNTSMISDSKELHSKMEGVADARHMDVICKLDAILKWIENHNKSNDDVKEIKSEILAVKKLIENGGSNNA